MAGHLFVFEGADGVGKSRRCRDTISFISNLGTPCEAFSFPGKKPGTLGHIVHNIHNRPGELGLPVVCPAALQALHIAAQLDSIERNILPLLEQGRVILLDRFWWSTWVYGSEAGVDASVLATLISAEQLVWGGLNPSALFLIDRRTPIRQEQLPQTFARLRGLYAELASREEKKYPVFTVNNSDFDAAQNQIQQVVLETIGLPHASPRSIVR